MSKANLYMLLLFAAFAFVCSCSSDDPDVPGDSSSSAAAEQKYAFCSYDEHEICLQGPFKACPGTGGVLIDTCGFVPPSLPSSSSAALTGQVYCVYAAYQMCLQVHGTIQTAGCPSPMAAMAECPYGPPGPIEAPAPVGNKGKLDFVDTDYDGKYYVGSTVKVLNQVLVTNFEEAKCGATPSHIASTDLKVVYVPEDMVDETGKLVSVGEIHIEAVATCAGIPYPIKIASTVVEVAPPPAWTGEIKFKSVSYPAVAGDSVVFTEVLNGITITDYKAPQCDSIARVKTILINNGKSMPGTKVEAAAFAVCRGVYVTLATATADIVFADPIKGGTITFKGTGDYPAETIVTLDDVTNNITVTNPVQSGCDLDSRTTGIENISDHGVIPLATGEVVPGKVKAKAYFTCGETVKEVGEVERTVTASTPILSGNYYIGETDVYAGTSVATITTGNTYISGQVDIPNAIYTACPTATAIKQILVNGNLKTTGNILPNDSINARGMLNCGVAIQYTTPSPEHYAKAKALSPLLGGGEIEIKGNIEAGASIDNIKFNNITNDVTVTNYDYTECTTTVTDKLVLVNENEALIGTDTVSIGQIITTKATISCNGSLGEKFGIGSVTVIAQHPIPEGTVVKTDKLIYVGTTLDEVIAESNAYFTSTVTLKNPESSGCTDTTSTITRNGTGTALAVGEVVTFTVKAICGNEQKTLEGASASITVSDNPTLTCTGLAQKGKVGESINSPTVKCGTEEKATTDANFNISLTNPTTAGEHTVIVTFTCIKNPQEATCGTIEIDPEDPPTEETCEENPNQEKCSTDPGDGGEDGEGEGGEG